jgi:hypothetical protein
LKKREYSTSDGKVIPNKAETESRRDPRIVVIAAAARLSFDG